MAIADLSDARRASKALPADDRDVTNGLVVQDSDGRPRCLRHGAMNRVHPTERFYRCSELHCGVGAQVVGSVFKVTSGTVSPPAPAVLRVVATDLLTDESETRDLPAGEYLFLTTAPCYVSGVQAYPTAGTHVVTIKGRSAQ
ncbi:MAG: hypothetical protein LC640_09470 [Frankia sp.]|nr:hypothetical protein [Frankia sp.]